MVMKIYPGLCTSWTAYLLKVDIKTVNSNLMQQDTFIERKILIRFLYQL